MSPVVFPLLDDLNTGTCLRDAFKQSGPRGRHTHARLTRLVRSAHASLEEAHPVLAEINTSVESCYFLVENLVSRHENVA